MKRNEIFIVGAGASVGFGLPSGLDLIANLNKTFRDERVFWNDVMCFFNEKGRPDGVKEWLDLSSEEIQAFGERLYYSGAQSIDDILSQNKDERLKYLCRIGIIYEILRGEYSSQTRTNTTQPTLENNKNFTGLFGWSENWLRVFFTRRLKEETIDLLIERLRSSSITFFIFNYDRCIEHFIETALNSYYAEKKKTKIVMNLIRFEHIYGSPGKLSGNGHTIKFGYEIDKVKNQFMTIFCLVNNIETVRRQSEDLTSKDTSLSRFHNNIRNANQIYLLGLSFNPYNFEIFPGDSRFEYNKNIFITTKGMTDPDLRNIELLLLKEDNIIHKSGYRQHTVFDLVSRCL